MPIVGKIEKKVEVDIYETISGLKFEVDTENDNLLQYPEIMEEEVLFMQHKYKLDRMMKVVEAVIGETLLSIIKERLEEVYENTFHVSSLNVLMVGRGFDFFEHQVIDMFFEVIVDEFFDFHGKESRKLIEEFKEKLVEEFYE